jgi:TctA family transporter
MARKGRTGAAELVDGISLVTVGIGMLGVGEVLTSASMVNSGEEIMASKYLPCRTRSSSKGELEPPMESILHLAIGCITQT